MKQNGASHSTLTGNTEHTSGTTETVKDNIESLFETAGEYFETRIDLYKLKAIDKASEMMSSVVSKLIVAVVFFLFLILVNIGIALLIGDLLGRASYGFLVLAGIYLIAGLVFKSQQDKWFKQPILNSIINKFF